MSRVLRFITPNPTTSTVICVLGLIALVSVVAPDTTNVVRFRVEELLAFLQSALAYAF